MLVAREWSYHVFREMSLIHNSQLVIKHNVTLCIHSDEEDNRGMGNTMAEELLKYINNS